MRIKRIFDLVVTIAAMPIWVPTLVVCALLIALLDGLPVFYVSQRRVGAALKSIVKFRTMIRNADRAYNRSSVPVSGNVRFLNTPPDSPLYTRIGRLIERCAFTEIPQLFSVLSGDMSLIGNRPLPENVIALLREVYPAIDDRFLTPAGMTGPAQLVGRAELTDTERLDLETGYCRLAMRSGAWQLDFVILVYTVLIAPGLMRALTLEEVHALMHKYVRHGEG